MADCRKRIALASLARRRNSLHLHRNRKRQSSYPRNCLRVSRNHSNKKPHIITSRIEHAGVLEVCKALEKEGLAEVSFVGVDEKGFVNLKELKSLLKEETVLVSIIHAHNEIGTIQDIKEISKAIRHFKKFEKGDAKSVYPLLHTDASQSFTFSEIAMNTFPVDLMTFNSSKIYGPKGVALLYVRKGTPISPIVFGGSQEFGLRAGTEDLVSISGFTKVIELAVSERQKESVRLKNLQIIFSKSQARFLAINCA
ncbi:MAG: aminotransferase class V-fold PLP-dependent enzyme [Candidatus Paceibacterota bacterium]